MEKKRTHIGSSVMAVFAFAFFFLGIGMLRFPTQRDLFLSMVQDAGTQLASVMLNRDFKSIDEIRSRYENPQAKLRVLIVPGHEPSFGGAEFGDLKEREMALELGENLRDMLEADPHYRVFIARDADGWVQEFAGYFDDGRADIAAWVSASRDEFSRLVSAGSTTRTHSTVKHNKAPEDAALRLYGMTKWANENDIDVLIHIHFNDMPRRDITVPGEYSGFSVYVPARQYGNSTTTRAIAEAVSKRLARYNPISDHPGEAVGIIDEPELIAVGSNNTSDAASLLIEYGYIYERQFQDPQVRRMAIRDLAFQTYLGIQDFFDPNGDTGLTGARDTLVLPHAWGIPVIDDGSSALDVFALQTALMSGSVYPPKGKSKNDCPRTGTMGPCTKASLRIFQEKHGVSGERGVAGEKTLEALNRF